MTKNQKSKNFNLSKNPNYSQFFYQWVWDLNLESDISLFPPPPIFFL